MKKNLIIIIYFVLAFVFSVNAQSGIENVVTEIARNNKTIQANTQYWETQKMKYKTGLTPYNPILEYDYLSGSPANAGNQTEFTVEQSFDFPSAYFKKNQLAKLQMAQSEFHLSAARQEILLKAKKVCIDLVYRHKLYSQLEERTRNTGKLLSDFKIRLDKGDGNILDVNKAQIQLIEINKEFQENISAINQLNEKLTALNGGIKITFSDTVYYIVSDIPSFEQLEQEFENADPLRKILEQEKIIAQKQVEVNRALSLPKFEAGYHYQGILGQTYNGIHTGISIPLWENKNKVKFQKSNLLYVDLELQDHRNEHYYEIKQLYEKYQNLKVTLEEYRNIFQSLNNAALLNKALTTGHISTIEYFMEMNYYTGAYNNYLQTEKEYYEVIAELYRFIL